MFRRFIADYLNYTAKERIGIIGVLIIISLLIMLPFFYQFFIAAPSNDHQQFEKEIAALQIKQADSTNNYANRNFDENNYQNYYQPSEKNYKYPQPKGELFYFDPNTLSVEGWIKLGVKEKTANTIQKYILKGGKFYKPDDIGKIWGLRSDEVTRLLPYVKIPPKPSAYTASYANAEPPKTYERPKYKIENVDINLADTSAFIALPGIGSKLANRIVAFRDKLGGFYKIDQVAETFALPDSTFQKVKGYLVISGNSIKKLNINTASADELKVHPYIRYNLANAIIQYRSQHGNFLQFDDLKKIMIVTDDIFNKLEPYVTIR